MIPLAHGYVRKSKRAAVPREESRHEIDVMTAMAERIGVKDPSVFEDPWNALEKACNHAFADGTFKDLVSGKTSVQGKLSHVLTAAPPKTQNASSPKPSCSNLKPASLK